MSHIPLAPAGVFPLFSSVGGGVSGSSGRIVRSSDKPAFLETPKPMSTTVAPSKSMEGFYKIVMVVDESGSMGSVRMDIIRAINDLIKEQQAIKNRPATFTLVKFSDNDKIRTIMQNRPLAEVALLSNSDYAPSGQTALYDAIGETIRAFESERDVLLVIVTDGEENHSVRHTKDEINRRVDQLKAEKGWNYVYISCDQATEMQGNILGMRSSNMSSNVRVEKAAFGSALGAMSKAIGQYRTYQTPVNAQMNAQYSSRSSLW